MNSPRKLLGLVSMETRRRRRALVIGYYLLWIPVFAGCWFFLDGYNRFVAFYFCLLLLPFLLGGRGFSPRPSPPVRPFADIFYREQASLRARRDGQPPISTVVLDEHDRSVRDRAHYLSYSALLFVILVVVPVVAAGFGRLRRQLWPDAALLIAGALLILFFSLPQTILLWTEPDLEPETSAATTAGFSRTGARP